MPYTCLDPYCGKTSHLELDERFQWCSACQQFGYAILGRTTIQLDVIVAELQKPIRYYLGQGSPFSLQFEQFLGADGVMKWRALIKLGTQVWKYSPGECDSPSDALGELQVLVQDRW
jgi:hypothetical protein